MSQSQGSDRLRKVCRTGLAIATTLFPLSALAQAEAPAPAPAAEPAPAAAPAPAPSGELQKAALTVPATAPVVAQTPPPAPEPTVAAEAAPTAPSPLDVNVWGRIGNFITKPKGVSADTSADAEVNLLLNGRIHKNVAWTADFLGFYGPGRSGTSATASILDLIGKFEFADEFNLWFGRMLVPSDRSNFSGAWFMSPWVYPGVFTPQGAPDVGPRQGPFGRNDGATAWGSIAGGLFKYYAGVFDLTQSREQSPLYTARINISLLNPEPGYYHSSTYYGGKDILAIGISGQYKKNGSVLFKTDAMGNKVKDMKGNDIIDALANYQGFSVDVLFEKTLGGAGTIDVEAGVYGFSGSYETFKSYGYGLISYLLPGEIGIGRIQPLFRFQTADRKTAGQDSWKAYDAQIGYAIKEYSARVALGYSLYDLGKDAAGVKQTTNAFILGIQLQK